MSFHTAWTRFDRSLRCRNMSGVGGKAEAPRVRSKRCDSPRADLEAKVQYPHALAHAPQWNAPSHRLLIIAGFFAGLGRCQSARPQSLVRSLRRPSPTQNAAISRVRNITSLQDKP